MASSSLPPRLANNPPSFYMESSSLLPPSLYTIEQAMVAVRSALACQGSTLVSAGPTQALSPRRRRSIQVFPARFKFPLLVKNHQSPWSYDHTAATPRQNPWRMSA
ncbi:hypothetical protein ZWY2020_021762 [Hordeum vulgare]|nr:hypothetical protein ZWY2020_021762 [Hordeum vulgare]